MIWRAAKSDFSTDNYDQYDPDLGFSDGNKVLSEPPLISSCIFSALPPPDVAGFNNHWPAHPLRYLFTLDLPEYWENKHADQTLEVLMSDLDPAIMDQFYMKDGVSASDVTRVSRRH